MEEHKEIDAISFCIECKIYMCNKCEKLHSDLFKKRHQNIIIKDKNMEDIFSGICAEENHIDELIYFCKTHNKLCCAKCIAKIKAKKNGQHNDCDVCLIEEIENEKKNKLKENIKCLEDLSITFEESIDEIKKIFEKINEDKELLKMNIQKIFTKLRNEVNNREDELLKDVDNKYEELYFNENIIKESEKLPNKIKTSLDKGKLIEDNLNQKKLNSLINDCLNIEKNIEIINKINNNLKKYNSLNININFGPEENEINQILETIKKLGIINDNSLPKIIGFNSKIVDNIKDVEFIFDRIIKNEQDSNSKNINIKLLYRATIDGDNAEKFHNKVDNINSTLTMIKTKKGLRFGVFLKIAFGNENIIKDNKCFVFSLDLKKIYNSNPGNTNINNGTSNYLNLYNQPIYINNNCLSNNGSYTCSKSKANVSFSGFEKDYELNNYEKNFEVEEMETFQIKFE